MAGGRSNDVARLRAEQCPDRVGLDDSGRNRVDPDASRREFDREVAHQAFRERLRDADRGVIRYDDPAAATGQIEDGAALRQKRQDRLHRKRRLVPFVVTARAKRVGSAASAVEA